MAQLVERGPSISIANFSNEPGLFCECCEFAAQLNRYRSYLPVTIKPQVAQVIDGVVEDARFG
jgi:hypothetical protein